MDLKSIQLLHDMLFYMISGFLIGGVIIRTTGEPMGIVPSMIFGWLAVKGLEALAARRRVAEVDKLRTMYDQPESTEK